MSVLVREVYNLESNIIGEYHCWFIILYYLRNNKN